MKKKSQERKGSLATIRTNPKWIEHNKRLARQMESVGQWKNQEHYETQAKNLEREMAEQKKRLKEKRKKIAGFKN